jgi:formylglycine-generating enzyme required for sulfatase activity/actin-like ATPase involved in cell morphogenesis
MHLGIDFGTTFSSAALLVNGEIKRVKEPLKLGYSFPSSVFVDRQGQVFVGQAAENQRLKDPSSYRREFKRELGTTVASSLGGRQFLPEELVTEVLKVLKTEAEKMVNQSIEGIVATVPASFMGYRYEIVEQAARDAGFTDVQLLAEPIAAAIYYDHPSSGGQVLADGEVLLVYDLGGGTFDAALLQKRGDRFELLAQPVGDENLGGSDFDRAIYKDLQRSCSDEVRSLLDPSQREVKALRARLKVADWVRDFKHQLSVVEQHTEDLPVGDYEEYSLSRWGFQELIHQRVQTTCQLCDRLVQDAGLQWEQVGRILLVGGSCRIPYVGQMLEGRFGRSVVWVDEPELAVCLGAAIYQDLTEQQSVNQENERQSLEEMLSEEPQRRFDAEESARLLQEELAQVQEGQAQEAVAGWVDQDNNLPISTIREQRNADYLLIDLGDGVILEMIYVPGGSFKMGGSERNEQPIHMVTLSPFYIGKYAVTQKQYQVVMRDNPSAFKGDNLPVERVNHWSAMSFCVRLSKKTKQQFQLPSEAQWEYACRAGSNTKYCFGDILTAEMANFESSIIKSLFRSPSTSDVGSFPPNSFGLYDMHGNVCEWCLDTWHDNYNGAPIDGSAWLSDKNNNSHVLRGGAWGLNANHCRSSYRCNSALFNHYGFFGFRVVLTV